MIYLGIVVTAKMVRFIRSLFLGVEQCSPEISIEAERRSIWQIKRLAALHPAAAEKAVRDVPAQIKDRRASLQRLILIPM